MATANSTAAPRRRTAKPAAPPKPSFDFDLKPWIPVLSDRERRTVERAFRLLEKRAVYRTESANNPMLVRDLLKLRMCHLEHEVFLVKEVMLATRVKQEIKEKLVKLVKKVIEVIVAQWGLKEFQA